MDVYVVNVRKQRVSTEFNQTSFFTIGVTNSVKTAKDCVEKFISLIITNKIGKVLYYYGDSWLNDETGNKLIWVNKNLSLKSRMLFKTMFPEMMSGLDEYEFSITRYPLCERKTNERKS